VTPTELKKVAISGGAPLTLCAVNRNRGSSWGPDGTIVFAPDTRSGLMTVSAAGGEPQELTTLEEGELSHRWPQFLPGGRQVLYTSYGSSDRDEGHLKVHDMEAGTSRTIHRGGTQARYVASGHLLYWREGTIFAAPFDLEALEMTTLPAPVLEGVIGNVEGGANYDVAGDGTLVYLEGESDGSVEAQRALLAIDRAGQISPLTALEAAFVSGLALSPDETRVATARFADGNGDVWIVDLERDTPTRLTFDEDIDIGPRWSPNGRTIYFTSRREGRFQLYRKPADGSLEAERLLETEDDNFPFDVSSDGRYLAYAVRGAQTGGVDLWVLPLEDAGEPRPFLATQFEENGARFSPDVRWITYVSDESGRDEVYVRPFPGPGGKWQVSAGGGEAPRWSGDGRRLLFVQEGTVLEASVTADGAALQVGRPEKVVGLPDMFRVIWDAYADADRFLFIQRPAESDGGDDEGTQNLVRFTFHWFEELRSLLATSS